jgi:crotonobetainyl-CoA:carnitine CoA-transferase CaiB-like acyl-CoA transferase
MFEWLGSPAEFADPVYDSIAARARVADRLNPLIAALFAERAGDDLVGEAAARGVPLARVLSLGQVLEAGHFTAAGAIGRVRLAPGLEARVPAGCVRVDGHRGGTGTPVAQQFVGADGAHWLRAARLPGQWLATGDDRQPFSGMRVLDLGVIVFGAEASRAFADLGADVIKVESLAFPDGLRQTRHGEAMNASFAWGHRNKRSLGLDLRSADGQAIFLDLVRRSDVVLSNFKPGTLDSLGIGFGTLAEANPGIVVLESGAYSAAGPWAQRLGYGPLVRASTGVSGLWRYSADDSECWDGVTVFPDHVAGKTGAIAVAAALLGRGADGRGRHLELAQSDVVLSLLAASVAAESLLPGTVAPAGNRGREAFGGLFACAGDDEWCVIDARSETELAELADAVGFTGDGTVASAVAQWTATRTPALVMELLQERGIPAGAMLRSPDLLADPQLEHRATFTTLRHPMLDIELPAESAAAPYGWMPAGAQRPAPLPGEHTREICREVLGMDDTSIDDLAGRGVVYELRGR